MPFLREKSGRWSPEKIVAFTGALVPALWLAVRAGTGDLNPARPVNEAIHFTGYWAFLFLVMSLAVSPARRLLNAPKLINMRRTLGVTAFCYAVLHLGLYVLQEKLDLAKVVSEIALRFYLTLGFVALIGLAALAATSTDAMVRRLGPRWTTLHKLAYPIAGLGLIHYLMQTKIDISESVMVGGLLLWLLGYRLVHRSTGGVTTPWALALTVFAAALTAIAEAAWYALMSGVMWWRVFAVNFDWDLAPRPAHWVLLAGLAVTGVALMRSFGAPKARGRASSRRGAGHLPQSDAAAG
jgi:sulfoxide reductase heme-binding subunit YedZ